MLITLCKNNKFNKETKKLLERNLKKVKFDEKGCLGECSACKKGPVVSVDGKIFSGHDAYDLFKKIKKSDKISDKHFVKESEKNEKDEIKKNGKNIKVSAKLLNDELFIQIPTSVFEMDDLKISFITDEDNLSLDEIKLEDLVVEDLRVEEDSEDTEIEIEIPVENENTENEIEKSAEVATETSEKEKKKKRKNRKDS